jgi:prevent-host-death family protein
LDAEALGAAAKQKKQGRRCLCPADDKVAKGYASQPVSQRVGWLTSWEWLGLVVMAVHVGAQDAKAHLAALLDRVEHGESLVITRRNKAIAELRPLKPPLPSEPRPLGQASDAGTPIPQTFFEPLPEELHQAFEGLGS